MWNFLSDLNWGDVPTWLAAIGTVGALFAVLTQINGERRRRHKLEDKERLEHHRAQARLIAAVVGPSEGPPQREGGTARTAIDLVNGSKEPVYRLVVGIVCIQGTCPDTIERWLRTQQESLEKASNRWGFH